MTLNRDSVLIWLLYLVVVIYNIVDTWQTILLVRFEEITELNVLINILANYCGLELSIIIMKSIFLVMLGIGLSLRNRR